MEGEEPLSEILHNNVSFKMTLLGLRGRQKWFEMPTNMILSGRSPPVQNTLFSLCSPVVRPAIHERDKKLMEVANGVFLLTILSGVVSIAHSWDKTIDEQKLYNFLLCLGNRLVRTFMEKNIEV